MHLLIIVLLIFSLSMVNVVVVLGEKLIILNQPLASCYAWCENQPACSRRLEEASTSRELQISCANPENLLPCWCGLPNPVAIPDNQWLPVEVYFKPDVCVNSTYASNGVPSSFRMSCNGTEFISVAEFHNTTSNCSSTGNSTYNLYIDTRRGNVNVDNGPGGLTGPFQNLDS